MKKRLKYIGLSLVGIVLLLVLVAIFAMPEFARGMLIRFSDFEKSAENIYISPQTPMRRADSLLLLVGEARRRNEAFWGRTLADYHIIYCETEEEANLYAPGDATGRTTAAFLYSPVGAYVIVGPYGLHSEVLAHELCHPELYVRIGWYQHQFKIPVWFFEGLAMQLDGRAEYNEAVWDSLTAGGSQVLAMNQLDEYDEFFNGNFQLNYTLARHEVARWLKVVGKEGLYALIAGLNEGKEFNTLYQQLEQTIQN